MAKYVLGKLFLKDFPVTQYYGQRPEYYSQFGLAGHEGTDFGTPNGTPFISPFNGVILRDTYGDKDYGNFTVVWDPLQHCAVWFCHLQSISTKVGDGVSKGQILGYTNNTGNSSGPHCHVNFVETDNDGNRLNRNNGFQGFLNILDSNLVSFQENQVYSSINSDMPPYFKDLLHEYQLDLNQEGQIREFFGKARNFDSLQSDLNSTRAQIEVLQSQINDLNKQITALKIQDTEISVPSDNTVPTIQPNQPGWLKRLFAFLWGSN